MKTLSIQDLFLANQRVLLRVNFNVPLQKNGIIVDDTRIKQATTSINYIISQKDKIIILSHLERRTLSVHVDTLKMLMSMRLSSYY